MIEFDLFTCSLGNHQKTSYRMFEQRKILSVCAFAPSHLILLYSLQQCLASGVFSQTTADLYALLLRLPEPLL